MAITAAMVKELRDRTGFGMMDCKKELNESGGDVEKAIEALRKKGMASAKKRVGKSANEGAIISYIHPGSRLGVMLEINCETDFVANTDDFKNFCDAIALQIAGANPVVIDRKELDQDTIAKEREIYATQARNEGKPEKIIDRIVDGKVEKYYKEVALLEQVSIQDKDKTIKDILDLFSGKIGEKVVIKRFARFNLGE